jgi:hypothetical protein
MNHAETPEDSVLWGAQAIADAINAPLRKTFHLLENGQLPAAKIGRTWFSTPERLRQFLNDRMDDAITAADAKPTPTPAKPKRRRARVAS